MAREALESQSVHFWASYCPTTSQLHGVATGTAACATLIGAPTPEIAATPRITASRFWANILYFMDKSRKCLTCGDISTLALPHVCINAEYAPIEFKSVRYMHQARAPRNSPDGRAGAQRAAGERPPQPVTPVNEVSAMAPNERPRARPLGSSSRAGNVPIKSRRRLPQSGDRAGRIRT